MNEEEIKALIVDDDIDICWMLSEILKIKGIHVQHVSSLNEAKDVLKTFDPFLILLDNKLPDGSGVDFISYLHVEHPASKIIFITGYEEVPDIDPVANSSIIDIIYKPFTISKFRSVIDKAIDN
jgi:two-component system, OmpR family, response regulator